MTAMMMMIMMTTATTMHIRLNSTRCTYTHSIKIVHPPIALTALSIHNAAHRVIFYFKVMRLRHRIVCWSMHIALMGGDGRQWPSTHPSNNNHEYHNHHLITHLRVVETNIPSFNVHMHTYGCICTYILVLLSYNR